MRLHAAMGLHLSAVLSLNDHIGLRKALHHLAAADSRRTAHVPVERKGGWCTCWMAAGGRSSVEDQRCDRLARFVHVYHERERLITDADQGKSLFGSGHGNRSNCGYRCTNVAQDRSLWITRRRKNDDRTDPGMMLRSRDIDRLNLGMRKRRAQDSPIQHAWKINVGRIVDFTRHHGSTILPRHRFSDEE